MVKDAEKNNLIYKIFNFPFFYNLYQNFIFAKDSKRKLFHNEFEILDSDFVLDIGCGPGNYRSYINTSNYFGIDINCKSIEQAKKLYPKDSFECIPAQKIKNFSEKSFDKIFVLGLLHHLPDNDVTNLFNDIANLMSSNTTIYCVDTSFYENQGLFSKLMGKLDKGNYVRYPSDLTKLIDEKYFDVEVKIFDNLLRVPCYHSFLKVKRKQIN